MSTSRRLLWLGALLLVAAVGAVYGQALDGPFVYDDRDALIENTSTRHLWPLTEAMTATQDSPLSGRPIVTLTFAINYQISRLDPWSYHLFNLLLHAACAVVLMALVRGTLRRTRLRAWSAPLALASALLWALHPLTTEAVQYVIQRTELMVALFYLGTMYCFMRGAGSARFGVPWLIGAIVLCALGMASKEVMVSAPLMVLLYDRQMFARSFGDALRKRAWFYAGLAATWAILIAILVGVPRGYSVGFGLGMSPWDYLLTQSRVLLWYLSLIVWPEPILIYHDWPLIESWTQALISGPVILALLALTVYGIVRRHALSLLGAWCFLILAPSSSFVPIVTEVAADRRMYLPLAAIVAAVVCGVAWAAHRAARIETRRTPVGLSVAGALIVAALCLTFGWLTLRELDDYESRVAVWHDVLDVYPQAHTAHNNLGAIHFDQGAYARSKHHFEHALEDHADSLTTKLNLANIRRLEADGGDRAETLLQEVLDDHPDNALALANLARVMIDRGEYDKAIELTDQAHAANEEPIAPLTVQNQALLGRASQVDATTAMRYRERAVAVCRELLERRPELHGVRARLAETLVAMGRFDQADAVLDEGRAQFPDDPGLHNAYGLFWLNQRPRDERDPLQQAIEHFREALRHGPDDERIVRLRLAEALRRARSNEVTRQFEILLEAHPEDDDIHRRYGELLYSARVLDQALKHARAAVEYAQADLDATWTCPVCGERVPTAEPADEAELQSARRLLARVRSRLLGRRGDLDGALAQARRALELEPADATERCETLTLLATALEARGERARAIARMREAVALESAGWRERSTAYTFLARLMHQTGDRQSALEHARRALELAPNNVTAAQMVRRLADAPGTQPAQTQPGSATQPGADRDASGAP